MHRVDEDGATGANLFREGTPQVGQRATRLGAAWFNDVQENICRLIEQAGLTLEKGDYDQLKEAVALLNLAVLNAGKAYTDAQILGLIAAAPGALDTLNELAAALGDDANFAATVTAQIALKANKATTITGGGVVTGGGDLSADQVLTVMAADAAQAQGWANTATVLTPANLALAFQGARQSLAGLPAHQDLPGGFIIKFGTELQNITSDGVYSGVGFVTAFPTACLMVFVCPYNPSSDANADSVPNIVSWDVNGFQARSNTTSGAATTHGYAWVAFGS